MPKVQPPFYNHGARPAAAWQLQASTSTAGCTVLSHISTNVFVNPPAQVGHTHPEFYAVDFDVSVQADTAIKDWTNEDDADAPTVIEGTGITVVPRAKKVS